MSSLALSLEEDGDEKGASENRCDFKLIDPKKGSATGYLAKYVCKNIDGKDLDKGGYGEVIRVSGKLMASFLKLFVQSGQLKKTPIF